MLPLGFITAYYIYKELFENTKKKLQSNPSFLLQFNLRV